MDKNKSIIIMGITAVVCSIGIIIFFIVGGNKDSYVVTFLDGNSVYRTEDVKKNDTVDSETPAKEGYIFKGWYKDGELYDFSTPVEEDIKLEAKWEKSSTTETKKTDTKKEDKKKEEKKEDEPKKEEPVQETEKRKYTITVDNGYGSGTYEEGTIITIGAFVPQSVTTGWLGDTAEVLGNVRYKNKTTFAFKRWNDGNTSQTRDIKVTSDATYMAEFSSTTSKVDKQMYMNNGDYIYDYPSAVNFRITVTSDIAVGQINEGCHSLIVSGVNGESGACDSIAIGSPAASEHTASFNWSSAEWNVTYNWNTGVITLTGGKTFPADKVIALEVEYSSDETKGLIDAPISLLIPQCNLDGNPSICSHSYDIKSASADIVTRNPVNLTIQLKKDVIVGRKNTWTHI